MISGISAAAPVPVHSRVAEPALAIDFGVGSECGKLRSVLLHRPGSEIDSLDRPEAVLWNSVPDAARAREQHDALTELYRSHGVAVSWLTETQPAENLPNLCFVRDSFAMTPSGAILSRSASEVRAPEAGVTAERLNSLGIPIIHAVNGQGTFEGADLMFANTDLALIAAGNRTNAHAAAEIQRILIHEGVAEVVCFPLPRGSMHLDCSLAIVDRHAAVVRGGNLPSGCIDALRRHGFSMLDLEDEREASEGMAINMVALEPGVVILPAGNPVSRKQLERAGLTCLEVDISELMKGAGGIHCLTGVIHRDAVSPGTGG